MEREFVCRAEDAKKIYDAAATVRRSFRREPRL